MKFILFIFMGFGFSCSTSTQNRHDTWPKETGLPTTAPSNLKTSQKTTIRKGRDGFYYIIGGLENIHIGDGFLVKTDKGEWPIHGQRRPTFAKGYIAKKFNARVALVTFEYKMPDVQLEGARITWEPDPSVRIGKGLASFRIPTEAKTDKKRALSPEYVFLNIGKEHGLQSGDIYAIASPIYNPIHASDTQISKRIKAICKVGSVSKRESKCKLLYDQLPNTPIQAHDFAVFLDHGYERPPVPFSLHFLNFKNDKENKIQKALIERIETLNKNISNTRVKIFTIDQIVDAKDPAFSRLMNNSKEMNNSKKKGLTITIAGSIVEVESIPHLFINYTTHIKTRGIKILADNIIDLGPIDTLNNEILDPFSMLIWSSIHDQRGRTSQAMMQLRALFEYPNLNPKIRQLARFLFVKQWGNLNRSHEALWLIRQDKASTAKNINIMQNVMHQALDIEIQILEKLKLNKLALQYAEELKNSITKNSDTYYAFYARYLELLAANDNTQKLTHAVETFQKKICSNTCIQNLPIFLINIHRRLSHGGSFKNELLKKIENSVDRKNTNQMGNLRIAQGLNALRERSFDDALLAFLEAEDYFKHRDATYDISRTYALISLTEQNRGDYQAAFEKGLQALQLHQDMDNFSGATRTYAQLATLYSKSSSSIRPGPYLGAADDVFEGYYHSQLAMGNLREASTALLRHGDFAMYLRRLDKAKEKFNQALPIARVSAQFKNAALLHLRLAMLAKDERDDQRFKFEMAAAEAMAKLTEEENFKSLIEKFHSAPSPSNFRKRNK